MTDGRSNSGKLKTIRRALVQLIGSCLLALGPGHSLYAQSCAMCYSTVAGGGKPVIHALQGGIIVLLIPPVLLFSGLTIVLFRWRTSASICAVDHWHTGKTHQNRNHFRRFLFGKDWPEV